ncbi:hypothetical protein MD484_g4178, partial [Candolleomyces efflorescens]
MLSLPIAMSDKSQTPSREASPEDHDSPHTTTESSEQPAVSQIPPTEQEPEADKPADSSSHAWQAIFSPQHNAYYFFNSVTQETTWVNPLQGSEEAASASTSTPSSSTPAQDPSSSKSKSKSRSTSPDPEANAASSSSAGPGPTSHYTALQAAAVAQGIDPALAYLDPSLLSQIPGQQTNASGIPMFTAKFNRHTGAFARADARDPSHLSETERAKRMSQFYFDVDAWETELASRGGSIKNTDPNGTQGGAAAASDEWEDDGAGGRKRKRLTKKDLERFKQKKKQKKLAKTAWLRS